jgi:protein SCO1/2
MRPVVLGLRGMALSTACALLVPAGAAAAADGVPAPKPPERRPAQVAQTAFDQRIGAPLPLDAVFRNETGETVRLGDYFGTRPVLLMPAYYRCPMLCGVVLDGLVRALRALPFEIASAFTVVTFSFDPEDPPVRAAAKKADLLTQFRHPGAASGWHFLTGEEASIRRLTEAIGFRYAHDPATSQYAHASGIVVATPDGRVSHYFYGVEYAPRDLRLALVEASESRLGSRIDQLLLLCFQYDATTGRYSRAALGVMRLGGAMTALALGAFVVLMLRREGHRVRRPAG